MGTLRDLDEGRQRGSIYTHTTDIRTSTYCNVVCGCNATEAAVVTWALSEK